MTNPNAIALIRHIIFGAGALGMTMLMLASVSHLAVAIPVVFFMGMASILYTTATTALVQIEAKNEMRGRVLALQTILAMGTTPIGGPLVGWLADTMGGRAPLLLGGIVCLLSAAFGYYASHHTS